MQSNMIEERAKALFRELGLHKLSVVTGFAVIAILLLILGLFIPKEYETTAVLYADFKNVIKPLLEGKTAVTTVDQAQVAKETLHSRRLVEEVALSAGKISASQSRIDRERDLEKVQKNIRVSSYGQNRIQIAYSDSDPSMSYEMVNALVQIYIRESKASKSRESSEAFSFIDSQVKQYKDQLQSAEQKLKDFQVKNRDGTQRTVDDQISKLRADIEKLRLDVDDAETRKRSISAQLKNEGKFVKRRRESESTRLRLVEAKRKLDSMLLSFTDTHPDVVGLKDQIQEMEQALEVNEVQGISSLSAPDGKGVLNPLYDELRKKYAAAEVDRKAALRRLRATENLLENEYQRLERVVGRKTELQELTRDYEVTRGIYEDLLSRKEQARMSMTLDKAGQGVSYKLQEPPVFPLLPSGLRLTHFFFLGPFLGIIIPLGLLYVYIELDPRVRMASIIDQKLKLPLLATIPHVSAPLSKRLIRPDLQPILLILALVAAFYIAVAVYKFIDMQ